MTRRRLLKASGAACAASAAYAYALCAFNSRNERFNSLALDSSSVDDAASGVRRGNGAGSSSMDAATTTGTASQACGELEQSHVAGFNDAQQFLSNKSWVIETTHFNNHARPYGNAPGDKQAVAAQRQKRLPVPAVELVKLHSMHYDHYELYEGVVPCLRIVGYFPNVTPRQVAGQLTDTASRLAWDANYRLFERLVSLPTREGLPWPSGTGGGGGDGIGIGGNAAAEVLSRLSTSLGAGLLGVGRRLTAADPPLGTVEDRALLAHRVASKHLERVGVAGRYFCYERVVRRYDVTGAIRLSGPREAFSILYRSLPTPMMREVVGALATPSARPLPSDVPVFMHTQEILLLPVAYDNSSPMTAERGTVELAVHKLRGIGGMADVEGNHALSQWLIKNDVTRNVKRPRKRSDSGGASGDGGGGEAVTGEGVLMLMTSVNDGKMPQLPLFAQRMVAQYFTSGTYSNLHSAIVKKEG